MNLFWILWQHHQHNIMLDACSVPSQLANDPILEKIKNLQSSPHHHHRPTRTPITDSNSQLQIQLHPNLYEHPLYAVIIILHFVDCYYYWEEKDDCFSEDAAVRFGTPHHGSDYKYFYYITTHHHHLISWVTQRHQEKRQTTEKNS